MPLVSAFSCVSVRQPVVNHPHGLPHVSRTSTPLGGDRKRKALYGGDEGGFLCARHRNAGARVSGGFLPRNPAGSLGARPIPTGIGGASGGRWAPAEPSVLKALPVPGALPLRCLTPSVRSGAGWGSPHAPGQIAQAPRAGCGGCWCAVCRWAHSSSLRATSRLLVAPSWSSKSVCLLVCVFV